MEIKVRVEGQDHKAQAQLIKGTLWIHHQGRTFSVENSVGRKSRRGAGPGGSSDKVLAPMPGKITKLLLSVGDKVAAGQAVLVMEAMKMEYTLKSDIAGSVENLNCAVGDQVVLGKVLVNLKAAE